MWDPKAKSSITVPKLKSIISKKNVFSMDNSTDTLTITTNILSPIYYRNNHNTMNTTAVLLYPFGQNDKCNSIPNQGSVCEMEVTL